MVGSISGYEAFLPASLQANVRQFISILEQHGIQHKHVETLEWQNFGGFEHRAYTRQQHLRVYRTCCFVSNDLFDGKLFKCSRSVFATRLGRIPDYPQDYVDVRSTPPGLLRQALIEFFQNQYPEVCQHCDGTSTNRIAAGVQVVGSKNEPPARIDLPQIVPISTLGQTVTKE